MKVKLTFTEGVLGTAPQNEQIYTDFIASKVTDAPTLEDEVATLGVDEVVQKGMTVFHKEDGKPFLYDYQIKGFFKGAAGFLRKVKGTECSKMKAYLKEIDGLVFVSPRKIFFDDVTEIGVCQRPLRAKTPMGERVSLAISEEIPAGASITFDIDMFVEEDEAFITECLSYGKYSGIGQWRNSGAGRFSWERLD